MVKKPELYNKSSVWSCVRALWLMCEIRGKDREAAKSLITFLTSKIPRVFLLYFLWSIEQLTGKYPSYFPWRWPLRKNVIITWNNFRLYSGGQVDFIIPLFHYFREVNEVHPDKHAGVWYMAHTPMFQGIHPSKCEVFLTGFSWVQSYLQIAFLCKEAV